MIHLASNLGFIRGRDIDSKKNYLLAAGYDEGEVIVFDIGKPGKEASAKDVIKLKNRPKSREVRWSPSRGEMFIGCGLRMDCASGCFRIRMAQSAILNPSTEWFNTFGIKPWCFRSSA